MVLITTVTSRDRSFHCGECHPFGTVVGMEVTYEVTKADLVDSVKAHRNRTAFSRWFPRIIATIAFVAAGVGLLQMASDRTNQTFSNFAPIFVLAALWAGIIWASPWLFAKRMFGPSLKGPRTIQVDAGGLHLRWSGGKSDFAWNNFIRYLEGKNHFLLYTSRALFTVVPKRAFGAQQLFEFRTILAQNIPKH
jgi:hypothetical protein